jgi:hypothetical protein
MMVPVLKVVVVLGTTFWRRYCAVAATSSEDLIQVSVNGFHGDVLFGALTLRTKFLGSL